jgi:DNA repair exonuclease SbcCD nuclease subunit
MKTFDTICGKAALLTDTHFGARSDSPIFHEYFTRFYDDVFFPYLEKNNIKLLLHQGDFTDRRKYINFVTLNKTKNYFIQKLKALDITMWCTVGNHDCYYKNTNDVNSMNELFSDTSNIVVFTESEEVMIDGVKVLLVPWINEENYDRTIKLIQETDAEFLFGHLELKGFLMTRGMKSEVGIDPNLFKKFKKVASGHYHHKSDEENISYLGSPYEMIFSDINDPRGFHTWEPGSDVFDFYQNPYKMFYKLYYDDKDKPLDELLKRITLKYQGSYVKVVVANRSNSNHFDKFIEKLFSIGPADVKIEDDMSLEEGQEQMVVDLTEDTLTILNKYVDSLEIDTDKSKIKEELRILYVEASNMER